MILKIDTQTGQTWMLTIITETSGTSNVMGFAPVSDYPAKTLLPPPCHEFAGWFSNSVSIHMNMTIAGTQSGTPLIALRRSG